MSSDYYFTIKGLFDFDKTIVTNELFSDGESYNSSKIGMKNLVLNGFITSNNIYKKFALNKILSSNKLKALVITTQELGQIYCEVGVKNRAVGDSPIAISIQLIMPDPYLYTMESNTISLGATSNSGLSFPFTFPIIFGAITGGEGTLTNTGNAIAYPVVTIVGTCNSIVINNTTTGESMSLDISLLETNILLIDSRPSVRGIYLNGVKRMDLKNGNWLTCSPGENVFTFQRNSLQTKQHCTVELQSRWI